jgi:hypothetical protein
VDSSPPARRSIERDRSRIEGDMASNVPGEDTEADVVWRFEGRYNRSLAIGVAVGAGLLAVASTGSAIVTSQPAALIFGAVSLAIVGAVLRGLVAPASRWSGVLVTDHDVVRVRRSGQRKTLPRDQVKAVAWTAEWGSGIERTGHVARDWSLPMDREEASELATVLGVPFHG